jgi:hypothetical protein
MFEEKFKKLLNEKIKLGEKQNFFDNIISELSHAEIPLIENLTYGVNSTPPTQSDVSNPSDYSITVESHWWGLDLIMNEDATQAVINGSLVGPLLTSGIAAAFAAATIITPVVAGAIGAAFAAALGAKTLQMRLTDKGNGVHWPITWLQWGTLILAAPGGPPAVLAALLLFFHPLPN